MPILFTTALGKFFYISDVEGWVTHGTNQHIVTAAGEVFLLNSAEFEKFKTLWFKGAR